MEAKGKGFISSAGLSLMPSSALVELLHRVEATIRQYSEELINQLARREELEFEKEVKNTFITALMQVQNRQKEQRESGKRRRRDKALSLQPGTNSMEKTGSMPAKVSSSSSTSQLPCSVPHGPSVDLRTSTENLPLLMLDTSFKVQ